MHAHWIRSPFDASQAATAFVKLPTHPSILMAAVFPAIAAVPYEFIADWIWMFAML